MTGLRPTPGMLADAEEAALLAGAHEACGVFFYPHTRFASTVHERPTVATFLQLTNTWEPEAERASRFAWEGAEMESAIISWYAGMVGGLIQLWHSHPNGPDFPSPFDRDQLAWALSTNGSMPYWAFDDTAWVTDGVGAHQTYRVVQDSVIFR